jgi:hypothetical protein
MQAHWRAKRPGSSVHRGRWLMLPDRVSSMTGAGAGHLAVMEADWRIPVSSHNRGYRELFHVTAITPLTVSYRESTYGEGLAVAPAISTCSRRTERYEIRRSCLRRAVSAPDAALRLAVTDDGQERLPADRNVAARWRPPELLGGGPQSSPAPFTRSLAVSRRGCYHGECRPAHSHGRSRIQVLIFARTMR